QTAENQVVTGPVDLVDLDELRQPERPHVREDLDEILSGMAIGGKGSDPGVRMHAEQAQQLDAGVSAGTEYGYRDPVGSLAHLTAPGRVAMAIIAKGRPRESALPNESALPEAGASRTGSCAAPWRGRTSRARRRANRG